MADVYSVIQEADDPTLARLADVLELRAADPQQRRMLEVYLDDMLLAERARVLEIGCGTGAIARAIGSRPEVAEVVGIDPSPAFIERARRDRGDVPGLAFLTGDGRDLSFGNDEFDATVCHTVLSHVPGPERVLAEALRVTRPGGLLAVFDGDYATTTVALHPSDPLQACADAAMEALVHDRHLVRRLRPLAEDAGWEVLGVRSHGHVETAEPGYMLTVVERGADALAAAGRLAAETARALVAEARRRADSGTFFGHVAYASLIARRPV